MIQTIEAIFDGEMFIPCEPLDLPPNTRVCLMIEILTEGTIELWRDREEMQDSTMWTRQMRENEWKS
ncbi:MAG TPA: antitoxin family protein [Blastocatellia bacterium]|nr:antitoxin family protein [Blastocatellia bacterium]